jgi:serine/threonine protein kinase
LGKIYNMFLILSLAKEVKCKTPNTDYVATRWYRAPEVILKSKTYNAPIDVFAVGAIMAELYNNKPLFPGKSEFDQMSKICEVLGTPSQTDWPEGYTLASKITYKFPNWKGQRLKNLIPRASEIAINLLEALLAFNPSKRMTASQALQHPFFQCFDILQFYGLKSISNLNNSSSQVPHHHGHLLNSSKNNSATNLNNHFYTNQMQPMKVATNVSIKKSSTTTHPTNLAGFNNNYSNSTKKLNHLQSENFQNTFNSSSSTQNVLPPNNFSSSSNLSRLMKPHNFGSVKEKEKPLSSSNTKNLTSNKQGSTSAKYKFDDFMNFKIN